MNSKGSALVIGIVIALVVIGGGLAVVLLSSGGDDPVINYSNNSTGNPNPPVASGWCNADSEVFSQVDSTMTFVGLTTYRGEAACQFYVTNDGRRFDTYFMNEGSSEPFEYWTVSNMPELGGTVENHYVHGQPMEVYINGNPAGNVQIPSYG